MACDDENYAGKHLTDRFPNADTFVHANFANYTSSSAVKARVESSPHDILPYGPLNLPGGMMTWLKDAAPSEDFICYLDADMIFYRPITPESVGAERGRPVSSFYSYMKGVEPGAY